MKLKGWKARLMMLVALGLVSGLALPTHAGLLAQYESHVGEVIPLPLGTCTIEDALAANDGLQVTMRPGSSLVMAFPAPYAAVNGSGGDFVLYVGGTLGAVKVLVYLMDGETDIGYTDPWPYWYHGWDMNTGPYPPLTIDFASYWTWWPSTYRVTKLMMMNVSPENRSMLVNAVEALYVDSPIPPNQPPVAADDADQTEAGVAVTIAVLENDLDADGDALTVTGVGAATGGSAAANTDGTVTYTPTAGFTGLDQFVYTISDGNGGTSTATVFVTVSPRNVLIDIKPGSYPNSVNLGSNGVVPVAILSEADFDATTVDPDTVKLAGAAVAVRGKGNRLMASNEDVNADGRLDLVLHVETENLDPTQFQDGRAAIVGTTYSGDPIIGSDEITIVPLN